MTSRFALIASLSLVFSSELLLAQQKVRLSTTPSHSTAKTTRQVTALNAQCPNQGGILDSISVPVNQPLTLYVVVDDPAPDGGATFELSSENAAIVAAGDTQQAFLPQVFIPAGETVSGPFQIFGITTGLTNLDIIPLTDGYSESSTPTTAWSVNPDSSGVPNDTFFVDANFPYNPCRADGSATLSSDPSVLYNCGGFVNGTVSDGVSPILLRSAAGLTGTACFDISSSSSLDQGSVQTAVTDVQAAGSSGFLYGFSYYTAPAVYGDSSDSRTVQIDFTFTPNIGNGNTTTISEPLTIIRPPVLLIHGLWSGADTWPDSAWQRPGPYYLVEKMDYSATNASNFSVNFPAVQGEVQNALNKARDIGFAANQVDVVGHSMGGILTRLYAGSSNFMRPDDLNMGDIRRLVTLDTPHYGASTANLIVSMAANSSVFNTLGSLLSGYRSLGFTGKPVFNRGAVCDLAENSPGLSALSGGTTLTSQVITGTGGPPGSPSGGLFMPGLEKALTFNVCFQIPFAPPCTPHYLFPQAIVNGFRFRQSNDTVVPLTSQQAGLAGINFPNHIHTDIQSGADTATQAFSLLDGPTSGFASSLGGVPSNSLGNPLTVPGRGASLDQADYASQCGSGKPLQPALQASQEKPTNGGPGSVTPVVPLSSSSTSGDSRVQITTPAAGQQFAPGATITITVELTAPLTASAGFVSADAPGSDPSVGTNYNGTSYQATFTIPTNFAGPLDLTPAILDSSNNPIQGVTTTVNVIPSTAPSSLVLLSNAYSHISAAPSAARIYVYGRYAGNTQINLSSSVTGTAYASSNPKVLTVDANGDVSVLTYGTAVVTIKNSGLTTYAAYVVENPGSPLAPQDNTGGVTVTESGFQLNRGTGLFVQNVTLTNSSATPIIGPLYFVLTGIPSGVNLISPKTGATQQITPLLSPYIRLPLADGLTLQPGASVPLTLQFLNPGRARISYTAKLYRTLIAP